MNYGKVEERSSSRSRSPSTARRAATSAILTDILSRSDRAPTSRTVDARPAKAFSQSRASCHPLVSYIEVNTFWFGTGKRFSLHLSQRSILDINPRVSFHLRHRV